MESNVVKHYKTSLLRSSAQTLCIAITHIPTLHMSVMTHTLLFHRRAHTHTLTHTYAHKHTCCLHDGNIVCVCVCVRACVRAHVHVICGFAAYMTVVFCKDWIYGFIAYTMVLFCVGEICGFFTNRTVVFCMDWIYGFTACKMVLICAGGICGFLTHMTVLFPKDETCRSDQLLLLIIFI